MTADGGSSLAQPDMTAVRLKLTAAAEIVDGACYKIVSKTVACVKMSSIGLVVCVYCNEHPLPLVIALDYTLLVRENRYLDITVAQRLALPVRPCKSADMLCKLVLLGLVKAWSESRVAVLLIRLCSPFAAVLYTRYARHSEKKSINKGQMLGLCENARYP